MTAPAALTLWQRVRPPLLVLLVASLPSATAYFVGKHWEDCRHFLVNYRSPNGPETQIKIVMDYALHSSEKNDVVFLGDSTCATGIRCRQFTEQTGWQAYNLGTVGILGIEGLTLTLRSYLANHPKPRLVVLCVHPSFVSRSEDEFGPDPSIRPHFFWAYGDANENARPVHASSLRHYIRRGAWLCLGYVMGGSERYAREPMASFRNKSFIDLAHEIAETRGYWENRGSLPSDAKGQPLSNGPLAVLPRNRQSLFLLAELAQSNDILLLVRFTPALLGTPENSEHLKTLCNELEERYSMVLTSRPELIIYPPSLFGGDTFHFNAKGAEKFTSLVAQEAARILAK